MNMLKSLFAALVVVVSLTMIACQGDAGDAREKAREGIDANQDGTVQPVAGDASTPGMSNNATGQVSAEEQVPTGPTTTVQFEHTDFDFGSV